MQYSLLHTGCMENTEAMALSTTRVKRAIAPNVSSAPALPCSKFGGAYGLQWR